MTVKITVKSILLSTVSMMLASCTLIPGYVSPTLPVPAEMNVTAKDQGITETKKDDAKDKEAAPISKAGQKSAAAIAWKDFFKSKELQEILQVTIDNNKDLKVAALNVEAARELYRIEKSDLLPSLNAVAGSSQVKTTKAQSSSNISSTSRTYSANLATTAFELDIFGKLRSQNESALQEYLASEENRNAIKISLIAETANAYLQLLADRKILKLTDETLAAQQKSYDLISKSHKSGVASKLDLAQVRTALETARVNKALYTRKVDQDKNALLLLMGVKESDLLASDKTLDDIKIKTDIPVGLSSEVLLLRPDIKQAEHLLKSANADIGVARAAMFPSISLTGSLGFASGSLSDLFSGAAAGAWSFVPQLTVPIFNSGRNLANLKYSKVQREVAVAGYEKAIQVAFREVADELAARHTLGDELSAQRQLVDATKEAYDLSYARYTKGIDSFLNVLDAQRSLFTAQQEEVEVEKLLLSNLVNLYKALGGGNE